LLEQQQDTTQLDGWFPAFDVAGEHGSHAGKCGGIVETEALGFARRPDDEAQLGGSGDGETNFWPLSTRSDIFYASHGRAMAQIYAIG